MHDFWLYFNLGKNHIANIKGFDHILFVTALCVRYLFTDWKKVLILITVFTLGHAITLLPSSFKIVSISRHWLEFLIPLTIIITAITNVFVKKFVYKYKYSPLYFLALFFGLIHGLGFSYYLRALVGSGNLLVQLVAFNLGLEFGQLLIVLVLLLITFLAVNVFKVNRREYILFLSGGVLALAVYLALQKLPF
jgi:hypothetical protein